MFAVQVFNRFAVRHHIAVESKLLAEQFSQKKIASGYGFAVPIVIAAHYTQWMGLLYHPAERVEVDLVKLPRGNMGVGTVGAIAAALGHAVNGKMLQG